MGIIFVVSYGRMTPVEKKIVRRQAEMNHNLFMDLLTSFIQESGLGTCDITPPDECPNPVIMLQDDENDNNTAWLIQI
jgi:hypothetical protein